MKILHSPSVSVETPTRSIKKKVPAALLAGRTGAEVSVISEELSGGEQQRVAIARAIVK